MIQSERETVDRIIGASQKKIWVTFRKEGIHSYPQAATDPKLNTNDEYDVSFLAHPHRHVFHFKVTIDVHHADRELEFIQFKRWLESLYNSSNRILNLNNKSCEMISDELYLQIANKYPDRTVCIEVSEDGENGSYVEYNTFKPIQTVKI